MMNNKVSFTNSNNPTISLSAVIYFPPKFDETRQYQAIVVSHPGGGVKEQTAGTYAKKLAEKGFVTIAYDASYQGESGGEPRQLENPYIRTEDISAVIDYLTTLSYVDNTRIGAMGICAGTGYTANAAIQDRRIKAIGTVSAVNIGSMFRNGWENNVKSIDALPYVEAGSNARTSDISSGEYAVMPLAPMKESDAPNEELRQAWEYYHTPRAQYPTAPGYATLRSLNQIINEDLRHQNSSSWSQSDGLASAENCCRHVTGRASLHFPDSAGLGGRPSPSISHLWQRLRYLLRRRHRFCR